MAGEEDVELRDLVAQSLEAKGVLGKIRAQLRANVFLALEEQESQEKSHPFVGERLCDFQKTKEGRQAVALVREFLEFFELDFTTAVFDPETNACDSYPGREQLARELGVDHSSSPDSPLLSSLLRRPSHPHMHLPTSHSFPAHSSLHTTSHHLPSHAASFPTSLTTHLHTLSHPHITAATERTHTITNGNSLSPLTSSDPTLSKLHHHQSSTPTRESVATTISSVTMPTITTVTSSPTTMSGGEPLQSTALSQGHEKDLLTSSSNQSLTGKLAWSAGSERRGGSGLGVLAELPTAVSTTQELDDFFRTTPPTTLAQTQHVATREGSDSSMSELLEEDSGASGKTTDVTQSENSLHGDYDFVTRIDPQEQ